ncbi:hypothetical protein CPB84DRAFT_1797345 [Gymnopilus junonius]|uniref:Secreted protein n=1 Tax=Gymnopilus junonius TaxID=109634 RepID=A0A9P5NAG3_GYMJU|nr:hypothetical protein CPB84DRAFT_1797345 [Gymnopilus junonius]
MARATLATMRAFGILLCTFCPAGIDNLGRTNINVVIICGLRWWISWVDVRHLCDENFVLSVGTAYDDGRMLGSSFLLDIPPY